MSCPVIFSSRRLWVLVGVCVTGFGLRFWGLDFGLPNESVPGESSILQVVLLNLLAPLMGQGEGSTLHPGSFERPSLFYYATLVIYGFFYSIGRTQGVFSDGPSFLMLWQNDPTVFYMILRGVSVVCGVAMIPVAYLLAKRLVGSPEGRLAGLLAAGLMATSYLMVRLSHFGTPAMASALLVLIALLLLVRFQQQRTDSAMWSAAVLIGLSLGVDYMAIALLPALWVILLQPHWGTERIDWPGFFACLWKPTGIVLGVFLLSSPWVLMDFTGFWQGLQAWLMKTYTFETGQTGWRLYPGLVLFHGSGGWTLFFAGLGLFQAWARREHGGRRLHAPMLTYLLGMVVLLGMMTRPTAAEAAPLAAVLLIYTASGMVYVIRLLEVLSKEHWTGQTPRPLWQTALPVIVVLGVVIYQPLSMALAFNRLVAQPDTRVIARQMILQQVPPGVALATGPYVGRIHLPLQYGQMMADTGRPVTPVGEQVQLMTLDERTRIASSFAHPQMFRDMGIRYVILYEGLRPFSNPGREWEALSQESNPVFRISPQKRGVFDWQLENNPPRYEPFEPVYIPFTGLEHFERPGPIIGVFDVSPEELDDREPLPAG